MASVPMKPSTRRSAVRLKACLSVYNSVLMVVEGLIQEREPFNRIGFPRAGAIDRLFITCFGGHSFELLQGTFFGLGPRKTIKYNFLIPGDMKQLVTLNSGEVANCLTVAQYRTNPGVRKYGTRNQDYARDEQGIFVQALHMELCRSGIENRIQGGINMSAIGRRVLLPIDGLGTLGVLA